MDQNTSDSLLGLQVDHASAGNLREGAKWARFISIVWFAFVVLGILVLAFFGATIQYALGDSLPGMEFLGSIFILVCIVVIVYMVLINILLYRFATLVRKGLALQNQEIFNDGLKSLKYYFVINGVIAILGLLSSFISTLSDLV